MERYVLGYVVPGEAFTEGVYAPSYTIGTALVTISLFAFLLSRPNLSRTTSFPSWGREYAVGVYVVHPVVLFALQKASEILRTSGYDISNTIFWHLAFTPATFFGALLIYAAARKFGVIEIGRSHLPGVSRVRKYEPMRGP